MLQRARIIKHAGTAPEAGERARVVPREVLAARDEAARIVAAAEASVAQVMADARAAEIARLAAVAIALRNDTHALERALPLATLLAERLVGEELTIAPARIAALAAAALEQTRGARDIRIDAHPDDVTALGAMLADAGVRANVTADDGLGRGSLVVHTELGDVDARLSPQLDRLAAVLRDAPKEHA